MRTRTFVIIVLSIIVTLIGCDDAITDWYYTSDEQENWITDSTIMRFQMMDENGITREFYRFESDHYYLGGSSYFAGIKYHKSQREYSFQRFRSNYNDNYYIDIHASFDDDIDGGDFTFSLNDVEFMYDYSYNEIVRLGVADTLKWLHTNSAGIQDDLFHSSVEFIDNYTLDGTSYARVFHFQLNDFSEYWTPNTVTEVYYAQMLGLVRFVTNAGVTVDRIYNE